MNMQFTDTLIEAVEENNDTVQFSIFDTPALSNTIIVTIGQYKQVLEYLGLDKYDDRFYDMELRAKIKNIYSNIILYSDILNYYIKYSNNLKSPKLFSDDWCFLIAMLLVEKNMFQRKYMVDPLARIAGYVNAYLYEKALITLPEFKYSDNSDDHISFAKRDYNSAPDFIYKGVYTAEAKKYNKPYNKDTYQFIAKKLVNTYTNVKNANFGVIIYTDKTAVVFNTDNLQIDKIYTDIDFQQIKMISENACEIN